MLADVGAELLWADRLPSVQRDKGAGHLTSLLVGVGNHDGLVDGGMRV